MKKGLVLGAGFLVISAGLMFASEAKAPTVAFTLASTGGNPGPISFTLVPGSAGAPTTAGLGGAGYIEDLSYPYNVAIGFEALLSNTQWGNTAVGGYALWKNTTGISNAAVGFQALQYNTTGICNTAFGANALLPNTNGERNTAIGESAGSFATEGSFNIYLGAQVVGDASDTNTIRIGRAYSTNNTPPWGQNRTFIAGIIEHPFAVNEGPSIVGIDPFSGQLGAIPREMWPPAGEQGPQGIPGLPGEGLVTGSLLFLVAGATAPANYTFIGNYTVQMTKPGVKRPFAITVSVYQKQ